MLALSDFGLAQRGQKASHARISAAPAGTWTVWLGLNSDLHMGFDS
jgi:hypothetical protein